jgi:hypothetical protein
MKKKIRVTKEYDIVTSECGSFCLQKCGSYISGLPKSHCLVEIEPSELNTVDGSYVRTEFCKRNEVKGKIPPLDFLMDT